MSIKPTKKVCHLLQCDGCGHIRVIIEAFRYNERKEKVFRSKRAAQQEAHDEFWETKKGRHYCQRCQTEGGMERDQKKEKNWLTIAGAVLMSIWTLWSDK